MSYEHPQYLNLKLPIIPLKAFDPDDSQLGLIRPNASSANTVFGTSLSERGKTLLAMSNLGPSLALSILARVRIQTRRTNSYRKPDPNEPHEVDVYEWNHQHSLAYNYLMNAL